jgi:hypothetical protein
MTLDINTLIWLFPIAFMLHDFEELIFFEPWLKKNAGVLTGRLKNKVPALLERRLNALAGKTTTQFAFPICLIFILTSLSSLLAAALGKYVFFLITSSLFLVHGFMHVGQAILLRRYVPSLITSLLIVIPYGMALFWRLIAAGIVAFPELLVYFMAAVILGVPFIIAVHIAGEYAYSRAIDLLVG